MLDPFSSPHQLNNNNNNNNNNNKYVVKIWTPSDKTVWIRACAQVSSEARSPNFEFSVLNFQISTYSLLFYVQTVKAVTRPCVQTGVF